MIVMGMPSVKPNGRCVFCNAMLKVPKKDHNFIRTRGYAKYYGDEKAIIKCPECKREQVIKLK
jgi:uncharacterized protein with PIN domain